MSHPIDDLFKRGLGNVSHDGHEKDWASARDLLGLAKRKKRPAVLLWWLIGILLMLSSGLAFYFTTSSSVPTIPTIVLSENLAPSHETYDNASSETNEINKIGDSENEGASYQDESKNKPGIIETNSAKNDIGPIVADTKTKLFQKDLTTDTPLRSANQGLGPLEIVEHSLVEKNANDIMPGIHPNTSEANEKPAVQAALIDNIEERNDLDKVAQPAVLGRLKIGDLPVSLGYGDLPGYSRPVEVNSGITPFNLGLYVGHDPVNSKIAGGISGIWNFNSRWSLDMGIGFTRFSNKESTTYKDVTINNRAFSNAELVSNNDFLTYSVQIPVRTAYHFRRQKVFLGFIAERPFTLNGRQEVSLTPENLDTASPSNPFGSTSADPIVTTQDYRLNNTPQLKKFFFYGQMGYGYDLTTRWQLSLAGTYRFTSRSEISPLIDISSSVTRNERPWGLLLRVDYRFGKH